MPAYTKIKCEICGQEISKSNMSKHLRRHENHPETFEIITDLHCKFCGKECPSRRSLTKHQQVCLMNPQHDENRIKGFNNFNKESWNKGLTKEIDDRLKERGIKLSDRYSNGELIGSFKGKHHTQESKDKIRQAAIKNNLGGHPYRKNIIYKGINLDSSLEYDLATILDKQGISWERCGKFNYIDENLLQHTYTPDFYLPEYDIYLDPKNDFLINNINPSLGYKDCDKIKWVCEQNNIIVYILSKEDVNNFDINKYALIV